MPATVGVPLSTPLLESVRPVGCELAVTRENVGAGLPEAVKVKEYAAPTLPEAVGAPIVKLGAVSVLVAPQPAVLIAMVPAPSVTVAAEQVKLFTVTVCAGTFPIEHMLTSAPISKYRIL